MRFIRQLLGAIILFFDWLSTPRGPKRSEADQQHIDQQTKNLVLYQYKACPFCVKVRRALKRYAINIEIRDAKRSEAARNELLAGGGQLKVPCLRIEEAGESRWMYESSDIVSYLEQRFIAQ